MADSILAQALCRFVSTPEDQIEPVYCHPFMVTVDGHPWAVATTGTTFMAVKGKASFPFFEQNTDVHALIRLEPEKIEEVLVADLRTWCGTSTTRDDAVIHGRVFDRAKLGRLLGPCPFPKARMGVTWFGNTPALVVDVAGKWRICQGAVDHEVEPEHPVWGKKANTETQLFDLAMMLE